MFDLRYHVASLAAVFLALIIGILVGVGISDRGLVDSAKTKFLQDEVASLQHRLDNRSTQSADQARERAAAQTFINETYPALARNRLKGKQVAVVFVGSVDRRHPLVGQRRAHRRGRAAGAAAGAEGADRLPAARRRAQGPAGRGGPAREGQPREPRPRARPGARARRRHAALELAHRRSSRSRTAATRCRPTAWSSCARPRRSAAGRRSSCSACTRGSARPACRRSAPSRPTRPTRRSPVFRQAGLSTVDDVDTPVGRLALLLLLAGQPPGQYGVKDSAERRRSAAAAGQSRRRGWLSRSSS